MSVPKFDEKKEDVLEWVKLKKELGSEDALQDETPFGKLKRKVKENPLVPIGALATVACLSYGLYNFHVGNKRMSQMMMRGRVVAQGFTILAIVGGFLLTTKNNSK